MADLENLQTAREAVEEAEMDFDQRHTQIMDGLAEAVADRGSAIDLDEYIFVLHGIDRGDGAADEAEQDLLDRYAAIEQRFSGKDGQPMARMRQVHAAVGGHFLREGDPHWVGMIAGEPQLRIAKDRTGIGRFAGEITVAVTRVYTSSQMGTHTIDLAYPEGNFNEPETSRRIVLDSLSVPLATGSRYAGNPGGNLYDGMRGIYAVGWSDIINRRHGLENRIAHPDTIRFLGRIAQVMDEYGTALRQE